MKNKTEQNHYAILGVGPCAKTEEIEKAFKIRVALYLKAKQFEKVAAAEQAVKVLKDMSARIAFDCKHPEFSGADSNGKKDPKWKPTWGTNPKVLPDDDDEEETPRVEPRGKIPGLKTAMKAVDNDSDDDEVSKTAKLLGNMRTGINAPTDPRRNIPLAQKRENAPAWNRGVLDMDWKELLETLEKASPEEWIIEIDAHHKRCADVLDNACRKGTTEEVLYDLRHEVLRAQWWKFCMAHEYNQKLANPNGLTAKQRNAYQPPYIDPEQKIKETVNEIWDQVKDRYPESQRVLLERRTREMVEKEMDEYYRMIEAQAGSTELHHGDDGKWIWERYQEVTKMYEDEKKKPKLQNMVTKLVTSPVTKTSLYWSANGTGKPEYR